MSDAVPKIDPSQNASSKGPHPLARAVIWEVLPEYRRERNMDGLLVHYPDTVPFLLHGLQHSVAYVFGHIAPSTCVALTLAETAVAALAFYSANTAAYVIAVAAMIIALTIRDAHRYPGRGTPIHEAQDALLTITFVTAVELVLLRFAPDLLLPADALLRGLALSFMAITMMRIGIYRPDSPDDIPAKPLSWRMTQAVTGAWILAAVGFMIHLDRSTLLDFLPQHKSEWAWLPAIALVAIGINLQKGKLDGGKIGGLLSLFQSKEEFDRCVQQAALIEIEKTRPRKTPWAAICEIQGWVFFCLPLMLSFFYPRQMMRVEFVQYAVVCAALAGFWVAIRRLNQALVDDLVAKANVARAKALVDEAARRAAAEGLHNSGTP